MKTASLLAAALIAGAPLLAAPAWAAGGHDHGSAPAVTPKPAAGQKWQTDAPLRKGMSGIRAAVAPQLKAVHDGRLGADEARATATKIETQVADIVANCKLDPQADAALHGVLATIGEGTDALAGRSKLTPSEGVERVLAALDEYGRHFEHKGWKPLAASH